MLLPLTGAESALPSEPDVATLTCVSGESGATVTDTDDADLECQDLLPPHFSSSFQPDTITVGETSILTFTITKPNPIELTGLNFTDTYPEGIENGSPLNVGGTCASISHTAAAGGDSFNLTGATVAAGATCTVSVDVTTTTIGAKVNTATDIGSAESGAGTDDATATLFSVTSCYTGPTATGTEYWKYGPTPSIASPHWYVLPSTFSGDTVTFSIADGGLGDDDLAADGTFTDQGGPGVANAVSTLSKLPLGLLVLILASLGVGVLWSRRG